MKIQLRKASVKDARFIYELRNKKTTRKFFFNKKHIKYNDHLKLYKDKLKKKNVIFLVALISDYKKIGTIRYERGKIFTSISIIVSEKFINLGYGSKIIKKSEKFLKKKLIVIPIIKNKNIASVKIFKKNNYKIIKNDNDLTLMKII